MRAPWIVAAALALAACGGPGPDGRNGPADPDRDGDGWPASVDCDDADSAVWRHAWAFVDADRDGFGAGEVREVCIGDALPPGWSSQGSDCDDSNAGAWITRTAYADEDHDGVGSGEPVTLCVGGLSALPWGWAGTAGDCAPNDASGWRMLTYQHRDADGDGATVPEVGQVCAGLELPVGYRSVASGDDCDDGDPKRSLSVVRYLDADGDRVGAGPPVTFCVGGPMTGTEPAGYSTVGGDCAPDDPTRWRVVAYSFVDRDGDGFTVDLAGTVCAGASLPAPYRATASGHDCDDGDATRWQLLAGYVDADGDGSGAGPSVQVCSGASLPAGWVTVDGDCAPGDPYAWRTFAYSYRDADGDGRTTSERGTVCYGAQVPPGYTNVAAGNDCDDANPNAWAWVGGYFDADGDGSGSGSWVSFCTSGAVPAGHVATTGDCAPDDPTRWRLLSYAGLDADGDGTTTRQSGQLCSGERLPEPYRSRAVGNDCDDGDPALFRWVVLYRDRDGDGVGAGPRSIQCLGATIPDGWSIFGFDPDDASTSRGAAPPDDGLLLGL